MVSTSKILTVSYGTFSCTLEGFDDSFETMKAIAEYFRDLAADDRYFGAEPPVPDAEMLARIAEREIARRVEARTERGNIVLRAADTQPMPLTAPVMAPANVAAAAVSSAVAAPLTPAADADADLAAKLQRIRAAVATQSTDYLEDEHAEDLQASDNGALDAMLSASDLTDTLSEDHANDAAAQILTPQATEAEPQEPPLSPAADHALTDAEDAADAVFDDAAYEETYEDLGVVHDDLQADGAHDVLHADAPASPAFEDAALTPVTVPAAASAEPAAAASDFATVDAEPAEDDQVYEEGAGDEEDESDDVAALLDRLAGLGATASDAPAPAPAAEPAVAPVAVAPVAVAPAPAPAPTPAEPIRARVIKVKRADLEAAIAAGQLEPEDEDDYAYGLDALSEQVPESGWQTSVASTLDPEEEAALRNELAAVEAELTASAGSGASVSTALDDAEDEDDDIDFSTFMDGDEATAEDEDDNDPVESIFADLVDDTPDTQQRRSARVTLDRPSSERDVTRLMAKTMYEMDEPESANRRSAIAHLRAAVAATRADKAAGAPRRDDTMSEAFRADLAQVVRPRRPRNDGGATARPVEPARPAPLKLVAEQRIDAPLAPAAPVRPRRIAVSEVRDVRLDETDVPSELAAGFADYVEEAGAQGLAEILEAAAAYLAFVEGRGEFSRPLLMTRARTAIGEDFNREDGLRSFGQLLRQGKIQKLKGGRFTVSQEIGFQPSERRAG